MNPRSIGFKLTAPYFAVLIVTLAVFGVAAHLAMEREIVTTVDQSVRNQEKSIAELIGRVLSKEPEELQHELKEHSEVRAEADFS